MKMPLGSKTRINFHCRSTPYMICFNGAIINTAWINFEHNVCYSGADTVKKKLQKHSIENSKNFTQWIIAMCYFCWPLMIFIFIFSENDQSSFRIFFLLGIMVAPLDAIRRRQNIQEAETRKIFIRKQPTKREYRSAVDEKRLIKYSATQKTLANDHLRWFKNDFFQFVFYDSRHEQPTNP